ncbi:S8 family serine peptidase [Halopiger djelfimassiliensis]|uniref:S8 family serine peptidase n=1 Tax=Halopiger djelfimassiliensis TaxID=1293047 RepID=UPI0006781EB1|nr:S8 family serine peptidase [Halopiger djelfimassiliensis]
MRQTRERLTAALLSLLLALSLVAIAGSGLAGSAAAAERIDDRSLDTEAAETTIDPALEEADGTEEVYILLDQYDGTLSDDRERAIEQLKSHAESSQTTARTDLDTLGGVEVLNTYWITNAIRAEVDTTAVTTSELASIDGVRSITVKPEYRVPDVSEQPAATADGDEFTYGLEQMNATETWEDFDATGEDVKVAVLDTGFDVDHPDLDLYTEDEDDPTYPGGWVEIGPDGEPVEGSEPHDTQSHGTHVGGTIGAAAPEDNETPTYGVAPDVDLQHALVLPGGSSAESDSIAGFEYVVEEMDSDVVSMSFGAGCGLFGPAYEDAWIPAIQNANDMGVVAVTSAGNSGEGCVGSPGNIYDSFSIGASNETGGIAEFSSGDTIEADNWDEPDPEWPDEWVKPDVAAPGADVLSSVPGGGYEKYSGTSMAAPHTSGAIALMLSANDDISHEEIETTLEETAWKPDDAPDEKDVRYGHGIIDVHAAVDEIGGATLEYDLGDVDQDESITVQDVQLMQQYLQNMEPESFNEDLGDLNRDGSVTRTDLNLLQQKVQGTLAEGEIDVTDLEVPDNVTEGETLTVTADLTNLGDEGAVQRIELYLNDDADELGDGEPVDTEIVDMAAAGVDDPVDRPSETTITFEHAIDDLASGDYAVAVSTDDHEATDEFTYLSSQFEVSALEAPAEVDKGETVTVNATIENAGNLEDTQTVEYRFDDLDETLSEESVTIEPGAETTVSFEADTDDVSEGTYEHGVFTEDDDEIAEITVLEAFFDVEITDAPEHLEPGVEYNVTAAVENTGDASDTQPVTYDVVREKTDVAVVDGGLDEDSLRAALDERDIEGDLDEFTKNIDNTTETLQDELDDTYAVSSLDADELLDSVDEYDVFVVNDFGDADVEAFLEALEDDQGVVFLENWASNSDAVSDRSAATDDPESVDSSYSGLDSVELEITDDHGLFDGVAAEGERIEVHDGLFADRAWFDGYSGDAIADVGTDETDGPAVGVGDDHVLLASFGRTPFVPDSVFTDDANTILGNAVEYASESHEASAESTAEDVSLEPGESASVEFSATLDDLDPALEWVHAVESDDDAAHAPLAVGEQTQSGTISGQVTASDDGEPVEDATIVAENGDGEVYEATTDADGAYAIAGVPAGSYVVNVDETPPGYEPEEIVTVDAGEHVEGVDFVVDRTAGSIDGYVTNAAGVPIEGATVVDADGDAFSVMTDENGYYEVDDLEPGSYALRAIEDGYDDSNIEFVDVESGATTTANLTLGTYFEVSDLEAPETATLGEEITINATITNTGDKTDTRTVFYFPPGTDFGSDVLESQPELSETVTLDGGESTTVEFTYEIPESDEPGEYEHGISADEVESTMITLEEADDPEPAYFAVSDVDGPATANAGDEITVDATITNTGDEADEQDVFLFWNVTTAELDEVTHRERIDTDSVATVALEGGESEVVSLTHEIDADTEPGTYQYSVSTLQEMADGEITVEAAGEETIKPVDADTDTQATA